MGHKEVNVARKRKTAPPANDDDESSAKRAKVGSLRRPFDRDELSSDSDGEGGFGGFSDGDLEDGGAEIGNDRVSRKPFLKGDRGQKTTAVKDKGATENGSTKGKTFEKGDNSKESHIRQKQLAQERKAAKPLADELQRLKKLWEKLRRKSHVPKEERKVLIDELFSIVTGRVKEFVLKHDAVRAVQTAVKYSTAAQRRAIAKELQGTYAQLAESRYAKFLLGKLLVTRDKEVRDIIVPEFYGKIRRLINHPEASWILDDVYRSIATADQKAIMLREWYGPEFALFKPERGARPNADLAVILADEPSKRGTVMKYLIDMANQLINKQMTGFTMLHDAMLQYFLNRKPDSEEANEFFEIVKGDEAGDLLRNMSFTKSGARLSCLLLAYGTAKDRKQLVKAYKDTVRLMTGDAHGHVIILAIYDLIDDTVLTSKAIFPEIFGKNPAEDGNMIFIANELHARTVILYLLGGMSKTLFRASHKADVDVLEEIHEIRKTTSKKDPEVRREELVSAMSPQLLAALAGSARDLVPTAMGSLFVAEVLLGAVGDKTEALAAVAATAAEDPDAPIPEGVYPPPPPHISLTPHGGKLFRTLIAGGRFDKQTGHVQAVDPPLRFADTFYAVVRDHIMAWATGPSSFAVVALLESEDFSDRDALRLVLQGNTERLENAAKGERRGDVENGAGRKASGRMENKENRQKKGAQKEKASKGTGNAGAKMLLEMVRKP